MDVLLVKHAVGSLTLLFKTLFQGEIFSNLGTSNFEYREERRT